MSKRLIQLRAKADLNSKIKKGFLLTVESNYSKPTVYDIRNAVERQYGREAASFGATPDKWEILS